MMPSSGEGERLKMDRKELIEEVEVTEDSDVADDSDETELWRGRCQCSLKVRGMGACRARLGCFSRMPRNHKDIQEGH